MTPSRTADALLPCPYCDSDNLRHGEVQVYSRFREGDDGIRVTVFGPGEPAVATVPSREIPGRRDCLRIIFTCEGCARSSTLLIAQHKGQTLLRWEIPENAHG